MKSTFAVALFAFCSVASSQAIEIDMKPGLWEYTFKMNGTGPNGMSQEHLDQANKAMEAMKKQMESMPPEQRKMMEEMMQKHGIKTTADGGIQTGTAAIKFTKDGTKVQACVTPEEVKKGELPKPDENCDQKITQLTPRHFLVEFECKGEHPSKGKGEVTFTDNTAYNGKVKFTTVVEGKSQTFDSEQTGKWLSTDCGTIKPISSAKN